MSRRRSYRGKAALRGEKIAMITASVFVLGALTVTGVYIKKQDTQAQQDGYNVDFSALEADINEKIEDIEKSESESALNNDLDYENTEETPIIGQATEITGQTVNDVKKAYFSEAAEEQENAEGQSNGQSALDDADNQEAALTEDQLLQQEVQSQTAVTSAAVTSVPTLSFSENDALVWPIVGNILINYSMDKSVYFPTLDQYKYNPALIIAASEGDTICAAADAIVKDIYYDAQTGNTVVMDIGDGYQLTYGQLAEIGVSVGQYIEMGSMVAQVAAPTRYYTVEGCNVYFAMTKDGVAINPMTLLE